MHNFEQKSGLSGGRIARHPSITGNLNLIQIMVAVGIHYKAFHVLVGANVDGAVEHGDIVVDISQLNGDVFVQIFTCGLVCAGTSFFNQSVKTGSAMKLRLPAAPC